MNVIANYDRMSPVPFQVTPGYSAITHTCCVCGYRWHSPNKRTAVKVEAAITVNKDGPYCVLCLHLEMAARYAEARGYSLIRETMNTWRRHMSPPIPGMTESGRPQAVSQKPCK